MEGAQTEKTHYLCGSGVRGMQNHRSTRLGLLQLFEHTGRAGAIGERKAYQHDVEILLKKKIEPLLRAAYRNGGREENSANNFRGLLCDAQNFRSQACGWRCGLRTCLIENGRVPPTFFHR